MARRKRRRRGGARSNRYGMARLRVAGMGAVYGALRKKGVLANVPSLGAIGATATHAVALHFLARQFRNRWLDDMATAVAAHCGVNLGLADFNIEAFASLSGDDEDAILGALPAD